MKTILIHIIVTIFLISCSSNVSKIEKHYNVVFPTPPDKPRIQFLTSISNSMNIEEKYSYWEELFLGEQKTLPINKPFNLCVFENKIYILDLNINCIDIIDLKNKTFSYFKPVGLGAFQNPMGIAVDNSGIYIADGKRNEVIVYDTTGRLLMNFGKDLNGRFIGLNIDDTKIYTVDIKNRKIHVFDKFLGELVISFPNTESKDSASYLFQPTHLRMKNDKIYVTDVGADKIKIYSTNGEYLSSVGSIGTSFGQFSRPKGIDVDNNENLFAIDGVFENVQIFNKEGNILMAFGGTYQGPGYMYLPFGIAIDYNNIEYFKDFINPDYKIKYLIYVTNQFGPDKVSVYGFIDNE